ncbi:MAG: hypothetical protein JO029_04160 [Candidatus Eremiobacteraeota bacterium]|nr:hypothetical protein [Candidatus Eremiobacteraeota bacterium]MBV8433459.1 hypothetical protein [Candidatus Eremiobacteraeota bacterium]MBV8655161.1 hypothetical protein [Candidatus Eremiobacteraeota bacterium]
MAKLPALIVLLALTAASTPLALAAPQCAVHAGDRLVLYGSGDDPDVLAWDSRFRLREYHAASFDEAEQLLPHASVEPAGTRAVVETCVAAFVQSPLFSQPEDAVGIMVLSGSDRGIGKWVLGSDVRVERAVKNRTSSMR